MGGGIPLGVMSSSMASQVALDPSLLDAAANSFPQTISSNPSTASESSATVPASVDSVYNR